MRYQTKKRFGQHFLHDPSVIDKIMLAARISSDQHVLEIGPGLGVLTERLLEQAAEVSVMEIDRDLIEQLRRKDEPRLHIYAGDVLQLPWRELLLTPPYTLVANLPYNISTQVMFRLLDHRDLFGRLVLMFQREVGARLCARPCSRDYGILSVLCQLWYDVHSVTLVKPGAFNPPPKIDSVVLSFEPLQKPRVDPIDENLFKRVVKGAFTQRRKTLRNSLLAAGFPLEKVVPALRETGIEPNRRGESLSLEEFSVLTKMFI